MHPLQYYQYFRASVFFPMPTLAPSMNVKSLIHPSFMNYGIMGHQFYDWTGLQQCYAVPDPAPRRPAVIDLIDNMD